MKRTKTIISTLFFAAFFASCGVYSFKDVSIDYSKIKTIKIGFIDNKARYINPQFSPRLTDNLQQKIASQTKLTRTNNDDAHLQLSGTITGYDPTVTVGVSSNQSAINRLVVTVHMVVKKTVENKTEEFDVTRNFDYSANKTLQQAEAEMLEQIVKNITDEIFNKLFSNW
jgi:hypothetical protein